MAVFLAEVCPTSQLVYSDRSKSPFLSPYSSPSLVRCRPFRSEGSPRSLYTSKKCLPSSNCPFCSSSEAIVKHCQPPINFEGRFSGVEIACGKGIEFGGGIPLPALFLMPRYRFSPEIREKFRALLSPPIFFFFQGQQRIFQFFLRRRPPPGLWNFGWADPSSFPFSFGPRPKRGSVVIVHHCSATTTD